MSTPPLHEIYQTLLTAWGPQHWWPGRTRFEIIVGAILTQNTAWTNVEKAIQRLRREKALTPQRLHEVKLETLAEWIRPAGYYNVKARRLRAFTATLFEDFEGKLNKLFALPQEELRATLLEIKGIGRETADSIILYAANRPQFVIDAYTRRILERHGWANAKADYDELAELFVSQLPPDITVYNEFHALIVNLGKDYCRPRPRCEDCPLRSFLPP